MQKNPTEPQPGGRDRPGAWRLTFAYDGDRVELVSHQWIDMRAPAGLDAPADVDRPGFFVEMRDAADRVVYQAAMHPPIQRDIEVFSPDPAESIRRVPVEQPRGTFQVVVPDLPEGETVLLRGSEPPSVGDTRAANRRRASTTREYVRVNLRGEPPPPPRRRTK